MGAYKEALGGKAEKAKDQKMQDLIIRRTGLEERQVCYAKIRALVEKG